MIARSVALVAALAAAFIGVRIYNFSGGLDSPDLRTNLFLLAVAIAICVVALKIAKKHRRSGPPA